MVPAVALSKSTRYHCYVLVGSRSGFECVLHKQSCMYLHFNNNTITNYKEKDSQKNQKKLSELISLLLKKSFLLINQSTISYLHNFIQSTLFTFNITIITGLLMMCI